MIVQPRGVNKAILEEDIKQNVIRVGDVYERKDLIITAGLSSGLREERNN